jgi:hypothetical protein
MDLIASGNSFKRFHFGCYSNEGGWGNVDELLEGVAAALPTLPPAWVAVAASVATGMEGQAGLELLRHSSPEPPLFSCFAHDSANWPDISHSDRV